MLQKDCNDEIIEEILKNEVIRIILKIITSKAGVNQTLSSYILDSLLNNSKSIEKISNNDRLLKEILRVIGNILNSQENENINKIDKFIKHILKSYLKIAKISIEKGNFIKKFPKILFKKSFYKNLDELSRKNLNSFYSFLKKSGTFLKSNQNIDEEVSKVNSRKKEDIKEFEINAHFEKFHLFEPNDTRELKEEVKGGKSSSLLKLADQDDLNKGFFSSKKSIEHNNLDFKLEDINISPIKPYNKEDNLDKKELSKKLKTNELNSMKIKEEDLVSDKKVAFYQINNNINLYNNQNYYSNYIPQKDHHKKSSQDSLKNEQVTPNNQMINQINEQNLNQSLIKDNNFVNQINQISVQQSPLKSNSQLLSQQPLISKNNYFTNSTINTNMNNMNYNKFPYGTAFNGQSFDNRLNYHQQMTYLPQTSNNFSNSFQNPLQIKNNLQQYYQYPNVQHGGFHDNQVIYNMNGNTQQNISSTGLNYNNFDITGNYYNYNNFPQN